MNETRPDELLDAIAAYIARKGVTELSLRPLAKAVKSSPRVLLYYFESKEKLVAAAIQRLRERQREQFGKMRRIQYEHPVDLCRAVWKQMSAPAAAAAFKLSLETFAMALRHPKRFGDFLNTSVEDWLEFLSEPLRRKGVSLAEARAFATVVLAGFRGFMLDLCASGDRKRVDRAVELWLRSLDVIKPAQEAERAGTLASDPFSGRHPTSHERMSGQPWDASYHNGPAPWDIGRPQPAIVRLASAGGFGGSVLDAGCGTGENALHLASLGLPVLGVDVAETAVAIARKKAAQRGIEVEFVAADAFQLERLGRKFKTVLDCGLFHTFNSDERPGYVASLASVTEHGGTLYVLCFSDKGPDTGPHPISQAELRAAFNRSSGWHVAAVHPDRIQTRFHEHGAPGWLATIKRMQTS